MRANLLFLAVSFLCIGFATPAFAYGGPGAAIGLLGAILAFGSAVLFAAVYGVVLPFKRKLKDVSQRFRAKTAPRPEEQ